MGAVKQQSECTFKQAISSNPCRGLECKEPIKIFTNSRNRKKCCHGNIVARYCQKAKQLQFVQWYGMQRTHKNIYKSMKQKKKCCQHLLLDIIENLISSNPWRCLECKELTKNFKPKKQRKSIGMATTYCQVLPKKSSLSSLCNKHILTTWLISVQRVLNVK